MSVGGQHEKDEEEGPEGFPYPQGTSVVACQGEGDQEQL